MPCRYPSQGKTHCWSSENKTSCSCSIEKRFPLSVSTYCSLQAPHPTGDKKINGACPPRERDQRPTRDQNVALLVADHSSATGRNSSSSSSSNHRLGNEYTVTRAAILSGFAPPSLRRLCQGVPRSTLPRGSLHWPQPHLDATVTRLNPQSHDVRYCAAHPT